MYSNNNNEQYSNARNLLASTFYLPSEEVAISAANYNYNHYNLPLSHIMIIVIISDEDMLLINSQRENWPFKTTLWCLLWRNDWINWRAFLLFHFFKVCINNLHARLYQMPLLNLEKHLILLRKYWRQKHDKYYEL